MKIVFKHSFFLIFILGMVSMMSCCDSNQDNTLTIEVISPKENIVVSNAKMVEIHIKMEATEQIHKTQILLTSKEKPNEILLEFMKFVHSNTFEYQEFVDLSSFSVGTEFQLSVTGCKNHECSEMEEKRIFFKN
ncbi:MAG: hypothetical protein WAT79_11570 [Saprospiraceae bacterium]